MDSANFKEELSLEETNKIRISLGLKPLTADDGPSSSKGPGGEDSKPAPSEDELAASNFASRRQKEEEERAARLLQERIERSKNKRELREKLSGVGLGEDGEDLKSWLKKSKKRMKENEKARTEKERMDVEEAQRKKREADKYGEGMYSD
jgi:U4/U6.U5 tri-snRNP-associated protein 1